MTYKEIKNIYMVIMQLEMKNMSTKFPKEITSIVDKQVVKLGIVL